MSYRDMLPVWWSFTWRMALVGMIASAVARFVVMFLAAIAGGAGIAGPLGDISGLLAGILVSLWALRSAINKHHFRLAIDAT